MEKFSIEEIKKLLTSFAWAAHIGKQPSNKKTPSCDFLDSNGKWKDSYFYFDSENNVAEFFDNKTGWTLTSDVLEFVDEKQAVIWTKKEPERRNMPALLDVGIMGHCTSCGSCRVGCYQRAQNTGKDMDFETYKRIIDEVKNTTFQVAIGGAGNPNSHSDFERILRYTREQGLVPNYTTAMFLDEKSIKLTKEFCGAVAISYHPKKTFEGTEPGGFTTCDVKFENDYYDCQEYTKQSIQNALDAGITTNIHYVLSRESINAAIWMLENDKFPKGLNAVIFLRYKPVGFAKKNLCLDESEGAVRKFFSIVDGWNPKEHNNMDIGFDSCMVPLIEKFTKNIDPASILPCEATRQSMYISPDGYNLPCSFGNQDRKWYVGGSIRDAWNSELFKEFKKCSECSWLK